MKAKSSVLTIRVPKELKHKIERVADEQGVSINQLALYAFTKEIKEMETSSYFSSLLKSRFHLPAAAAFSFWSCR